MSWRRRGGDRWQRRRRRVRLRWGPYTLQLEELPHGPVPRLPQRLRDLEWQAVDPADPDRGADELVHRALARAGLEGEDEEVRLAQGRLARWLGRLFRRRR